MANKLLVWAVPVLGFILGVVQPGLAQPKAPPGPAPGTLVDARPVILFESGGGGFSQDWSAVQKILGERVRSCGYDRAGLGWGEPGPAPRTMRQEVFELHAAREAMGIPTP